MSIDLYKQEIEKRAGLESLLPTIAKGVKSFSGSSLGKRALIGAGVGAAGGALTANPNQKGGRLGAAASGALTGGLLGANINNKNIASAGKGLVGLGEKAYYNSANSPMLGEVGLGMKRYGNKIQNYFG